MSISIQDIGRGIFYKGKCGFSVVHGKKKKNQDDFVCLACSFRAIYTALSYILFL